MAFVPKVRLKWREPKGFVEERDCRERKAAIWWQQIVGIAIVVILMMPVWFLATLNPKKNPPSFEIALMLAIFLGIFLVYLVPWIIRFCPSEIKLTDDALFVLRGNRHRSAKWKDISSFTFAEECGFQVLRLNLCKGGDLELGLDSSVQEAEVRLFLEGVGVSINNSEQGVAPNESPASSSSRNAHPTLQL